MSGWTAEHLDALPEGTVIAWEEFGVTIHAAFEDGSWYVIGGDRIRDWQNILGWADPESIRVVSVPIDALLSDETIRAAGDGHYLGQPNSRVRTALHLAIAHVTGGAS